MTPPTASAGATRPGWASAPGGRRSTVCWPACCSTRTTGRSQGSRRPPASGCRTWPASDGSPTRSPPSRTSRRSPGTHDRWPSGRHRCAGPSTPCSDRSAASTRRRMRSPRRPRRSARSSTSWSQTPPARRSSMRSTCVRSARRSPTGWSAAGPGHGCAPVTSASRRSARCAACPSASSRWSASTTRCCPSAARTTTTCSRSPHASASATHRPNGGPHCSTRCSRRATR
jgi:hypothetical protein